MAKFVKRTLKNVEGTFWAISSCRKTGFPGWNSTAAAEVCRIMMGVVMGEEIYASRQIDAVKMMAHLHMHKAWERRAFAHHNTRITHINRQGSSRPLTQEFTHFLCKFFQIINSFRDFFLQKSKVQEITENSENIAVLLQKP
jgi:hypothetical protein